MPSYDQIHDLTILFLQKSEVLTGMKSPEEYLKVYEDVFKKFVDANEALLPPIDVNQLRQRPLGF